MSLHNDIMYLSDTIKKSKTEIKEEEKTQKEIIKNILQDQFTAFLYNVHSLNDLEILTRNFLVNKSKNVLTVASYYEEITKQKANKNLIDFIYNNYTSILLNTKKDIETVLKIEHKQEKEKEKILLQLEKEEEKKRQEELKIQEEIKRAYSLQVKREKQQRAETLQGVSNLLLGLACLVGLPFVLIIFFIIGITKNVK